MIKNIEGKLTITRRRDNNDEQFICIELGDEKAIITPIEIKILPEKLMMALTGFASQDCTFDVQHLEKIGKIKEQDTITFPVTNTDKANAAEEAKKHTPEGWIARTSFNSQNSFSYNNKSYIAKTQIIRWVDRE